MSNESSTHEKPIRYAVVGLGHIAQVAVLPAFKHAENSKLVALVSDNREKLDVLGKQYKVKYRATYDEYDQLLQKGEVDAVYITLPNHMHHEYTIRAARAGVHVLCEKPMAVTTRECDEMIQATEDARVQLMIAYRLHFEESNMKVVEVVQSGQLGETRAFDSVFTMQVEEGNIRLRREMGGGTLYDIGIYCINAARYVFRDEPTQVFAASVRGRDPRFADVDEMTSAVLRFPGDRLAAFTTSFGGGDVASYRVVGTKGSLRLDPAYEYVGERRLETTIEEKTDRQKFKAADQFAPELIHFSECVRAGERPGPDGREGRQDVRIIEALYSSAEQGVPIDLAPTTDIRSRPGPDQVIRRPPVKKPHLVDVSSPHPN